MAGIVQRKGRGLTFAEQQLKRHGWEEGKGLGRAENGITEAIKVKVKCNKGGVGHKEGEQFTFHWWDHVFNKASSSVQVDSDQNSITVKKTVAEGEEDTMVSFKKPRQTSLAKAKLYGCFVKSATLRSGQEQPEPRSSHSSSSSSDEDDDQKLDLSSTTKLSDAELMKVCGGRTAHKGARHGLTMSAKLARLEQQEAEFMAKYGKRNQPAKKPTLLPSSQSAYQEVETDKNLLCKKTKKKKSLDAAIEVNGEVLTIEPEIYIKAKKRRKKAKKKTEENLESVLIAQDDSILTNNVVTKKNKKKKSKVDDAPPQFLEPFDTKEEEKEEKKKKKKKKRKAEEHREAVEEVVGSNAKKGGSESNQNGDSNPSITSSAEVIEEEENSAKQKNKKHKKKRDSAIESIKQETFSPKKKKSKTED